MKLKEYDIYIFDFDGTLSDTIPGVKNSVKYALTFLGIDETDDKKLDFFIGPPLFESFTKIYNVDEKTANMLIAKYRERYSKKACEESTLYPGVEEMLKELKARKKKLAIASSKPLLFVEEIAKALGIFGLFDYIAGETFEHTHSSKKDLINEALEALGAGNKEKALMTGDRFYDIEGANLAGIDSAGAVYGFGNEEELEKAGATYLLYKPSDILNL